MSLHPSDVLYALNWAVKMAEAGAKNDSGIRLDVLPTLRDLRDQAQRESRK